MMETLGTLLLPFRPSVSFVTHQSRTGNENVFKLAFCRGNNGGSDGDHRKSDERCLIGITAGIAVVLSLLVVLPVGVVLGCCGMWCLIRERERRHHFSDKGSESREESHYDVPVPTQSAITVTHNQAYASGNQRQ